jgi:prepilin-type N-terminal cleavage/methylation domain-containing protein
MSDAKRPRGFTLVELCITIVIAAILVRVALPNYLAMIRNGRAARAVSELMVVRAAAFSYYTERGTWPAEGAAGQVPAALAPYLPPRFSFNRGSYRIDWENWVLPNGLPRFPNRQTMLGVSVVTNEKALGNAVLKLLARANPRLTHGTSYTLLIVGAGEGS